MYLTLTCFALLRTAFDVTPNITSANMILYTRHDTSREYWIHNRHEDYLTDILLTSDLHLTSDFQTLTQLRARLSWRMNCPGSLTRTRKV